MNIGIEELVKIRQIMDEYRRLYGKFNKVTEEITALTNRISDLEDTGRVLLAELKTLRDDETKMLEAIRSAPDFNQEEFQRLLFSI
jgi:predicted nuclease with TOPRIM domain